MEPEGSIPHSHVSATCPYPEPARSSPYLPEYLVILSYSLRVGLPRPPTAHCRFMKRHYKVSKVPGHTHFSPLLSG